jgi:hypothetical protein
MWRSRRREHFEGFGYDYDIYKTKQGWRAKLKFMLLAEKLVQQNIDPALYIKIMCRYGKFRSLKWMPHPTWLEKNKTIETFKWVYRSQKRSYGLHLDFKKAISGWSDIDIYNAIRDSAGMMRTAMETTGLSVAELMTTPLGVEMSPWFNAIHTLMSRECKDFKKCYRLLNRNRYARRTAQLAYRRSFSRL